MGRPGHGMQTVGRPRKVLLVRARAGEILEERSPRYRAAQKKDKKTALRSPSISPFSGKRRLLTRGSGEVSGESNDGLRMRPPNVSGVSQVGDRPMNFEPPKPDRRLVVACKNPLRFARLRSAVKMIVDVGT